MRGKRGRRGGGRDVCGDLDNRVGRRGRGGVERKRKMEKRNRKREKAGKKESAGCAVMRREDNGNLKSKGYEER